LEQGALHRTKKSAKRKELGGTFQLQKGAGEHRRWRRAFISLTVLMLVLFELTSTYLPVLAASEQTYANKRFIQIEGGNFYSIALRNDGSVWGWGRNLLGELGLQETVTFRNTNAPVRLNGLDSIKTISVAGGESGHNLAVKTDGSVWQWGTANGFSDNKIHSLLPHKIEGVSDAIAVAAGLSYGIALRKDGTVWSWGRYPNAMDLKEVRQPAAVKGLSKIVQVALDGQKGYAVKKDGSVWSWNEPSDRKSQQVTAAMLPVKVTGFTNIRQVSAWEGRLLALDGEGKLWTLNAESKRVALHPELTIKEVRIGARYGSSNELLLTTAGEVFSFGKTVTGKQGKVDGLPKIVSIGAGTYHNLAISENGEVWGWGGNKFVEVGRPAMSSDGIVYRPLQARADIDVAVNGIFLHSIYPAIASDHTVQIPIRDVTTALGAGFTSSLVDGNIRNYFIRYRGRTVTFQQGQSRAWIDTEEINLPDLISGVPGAVTVPYQLLQIGLGLTVIWDSESGELAIADNE